MSTKFARIFKANPYHDSDGRFTSAGGSSGSLSVDVKGDTSGPHGVHLKVKNGEGKHVGEMEMSFNVGKGSYEIRHALVDDSERGKGYGKEMYKKAFDFAEKQGRTVNSDRAISAMADKVWQSFQKEGYPVEKNPDAKFDGKKWDVRLSDDGDALNEPVWYLKKKN